MLRVKNLKLISHYDNEKYSTYKKINNLPYKLNFNDLL